MLTCQMKPTIYMYMCTDIYSEYEHVIIKPIILMNPLYV